MKIYFVIPENNEFTIYYMQDGVEVRVNSYTTKLGALEICNHNNARQMDSPKYKKYLLEEF